MLLQRLPPIHLAHTFGVHPGEKWTDHFETIKENVITLKGRVCPEQLFGIGMCLTQQEALRFARDEAAVHEVLEFFTENGVYVCLMDGSTYGRSHAGSAKEDLYEPDWRTTERRNFTIHLAEVLSQLLPPGVEGSISTVPCSLKLWITDDEDRLLMARHLAEVVARLVKIADETGRRIHLCLPPEPDCYLETTQSTISFIKETMQTTGVEEVMRILGCEQWYAEEMMHRHFGVAFDTCHLTMQFEDLGKSLLAYKAAGIRISRVQLSAPMLCPWNADNWEALLGFDEPVNLHQVRAVDTAGRCFGWHDLPAALHELPNVPDLREVRVHFHLPLSIQKIGGLAISVAPLHSPEFFQQLRDGTVPHIEIKAGTFDVHPEEAKSGGMLKSIAREYAWVLEKLGFRD